MLAQVELADIVRLRKLYQPHRESGLPEPRGPYQFGIVAEILNVLPTKPEAVPDAAERFAHEKEFWLLWQREKLKREAG